MKKLILFISMIFACSNMFASKVNLMEGYTSMPMDMVSYGDTVYEAVMADNANDNSKDTPIYINKYFKNEYQTTLQITVEGLKNYDFDENFSHYKYVKLFALGPDEIAMTIYSAFSDNRFAYFRIKKGKVISYKSYSLKEQRGYETQYFSYNGKDRIYVAFNGTGDKLYILALDLDGKIKNSVTFYNKSKDECLIGLAACKENVFLQMGFNAYKHTAVLKFSRELKYTGLLGFSYTGNDLGRMLIEENANPNYLMLYASNKNFQDYFVKYSPDGDFICAYEIQDNKSDDRFNMSYCTMKDDGILVFGQRVKYDQISDPASYKPNFAYFMNWEGKVVNEILFEEENNFKISDYEFIDGKYFCTADYVYSADGIGHVAYNYLVDGPFKETHYMSFNKSSFDPFAIPQNESHLKSYNSQKEYWEENILVEEIKIADWDFKYQAKIMQLNFSHRKPDSKEVTRTLPLFPFSER
ncbi:hypothetical protein [Treponema sp.]|uniref:hypothetical protein n=1 Tax=Treponema sp. TaxID=166 RepID=UPI0025CC186D|nr:hypothetical protein [Treponema sp.]MCR5218421.1 hypothetical protein [Treponema sp.]